MATNKKSHVEKCNAGEASKCHLPISVEKVIDVPPFSSHTALSLFLNDPIDFLTSSRVISSHFSRIFSFSSFSVNLCASFVDLFREGISNSVIHGVYVRALRRPLIFLYEVWDNLFKVHRCCVTNMGGGPILLENKVIFRIQSPAVWEKSIVN